MSSTSIRHDYRTYASDSDDDIRREIIQLRCKIANQPVIEQAKGMLMGAFGLSSDHAFALLRSLSQTNNVKVRCVAHHIVEYWTSGGPRPVYEEAAEFLAAVRRRINAD